MSTSPTRKPKRIASLLALMGPGLGLLLLLTPSPARADDAAVRRFAATLASIEDAPEPLTALFSGLQALEGLRLDENDGPAVAKALGPEHKAIAGVAEALREVSIQGGVIRLALARPLVITLKRGVVSLATDVGFRVRTSPQGDLTVDETRGIKVGRSASLLLPLRKLAVGTEDGKRVGHAEVMIGFLAKTLTFDAPPAAGAATPAGSPHPVGPSVGLVGALGTTSP
jgi:hypothetical protein